MARASLTNQFLSLLVALRLILFVSNVPSVLAADTFRIPSSLATTEMPASQVYPPEQFLQLTNLERKEAGVAPLRLNRLLDQAALAKAEDMQHKHYFEHFYHGVTPWDFIHQAGYFYQVAGENLAQGFKTPQGITAAWMASPAHQHNLLNPHYQDVGFACIESTDASGNNELLTVQMFGAL